MNQAADVFDGLVTRLVSFADEFSRLARNVEQKALAGTFAAFVADQAHVCLRYLSGLALGADAGGQTVTGPSSRAVFQTQSRDESLGR